jgi:hypothetical protein
MKWAACLILWLGLMVLPCSAAADETPSRNEAVSQGIRWTDGRVHGQINGMPLVQVLQNLAHAVGFEIQVFGNLNMPVSITFDGLTVDESVQRLNRQSSFNYILLSNGPTQIEKLVVIAAAGSGASSSGMFEAGRPAKIRPPGQPAPSPDFSAIGSRSEEEVIQEETEAYQEAPEEEQVLPSADQGEDEDAPQNDQEETGSMEGAPKELVKFIDQLSDEEQISPEEKALIMEKIRQGDE